jgi:amidohydrolase
MCVCQPQPPSWTSLIQPEVAADHYPARGHGSAGADQERRHFLRLAALLPFVLAAGPSRAWAQASSSPTAANLSGLATKAATLVDGDQDRLINIFKQLHADPELAFQEVKTSALVAREFTRLGYDTHSGLGKTGVVGVLRNGSGPVVMFRGDMDALPVKENTGLPYASKVTVQGAGGTTVPVTHACGHDAHTTFLIGVAKVMKDLQGEWSGTLILVGQPAEEPVTGATAMVDDGLYTKVPKPDYLIAPHVLPNKNSRQIGLRPGKRMAGTDQIDVTFFGVGGHGSAPQYAVDPVVMASRAVMDYQTLISREADPFEPLVLTVGAFQAGNTNNVIPDRGLLMLNLRWWDERPRQRLIDGIKRISRHIALSAGMPEDRMPEVTIKGSAGPVYNDEAATARVAAAATAILGKDSVVEGTPPVMGSEDFPNLKGPHKDVKLAWIEVGCAPSDLLDEARRAGRVAPYVNHNPRFFVDLPAIATGTKACSMVLLDLLQRTA